MRLPVLDDPSYVDVALVGVPLDGGTDSVDSAFAPGTGTLKIRDLTTREVQHALRSLYAAT